MTNPPDSSGTGVPRVMRHAAAGLPDGGFPYSATVTAGPLLVTAGISPFDTPPADPGNPAISAPGDVAAQTRRCLRNLRDVLAERGAGLDDLAKLTVYVATGERSELAEAWGAVLEAFGPDLVPPAMLVGVTVLPYDGQVVEVDALVAPPVST